MATVVIGGLDSHASSDLVTNYCQKFGRLLNCYVNAGQCVVTFANRLHATEFIRAAPHQIGSSSQVTACWKSTMQQTAPPPPRPPSDSHDHCRLTVRGTLEQLQQNSLLQYFSRYGQVRMCLPNPAQGCATVTFTDRTGCERVLKEARHFLNGRSLVVELCTEADNVPPSKRMKLPEPVISSSNARVDQDKQQAHLQERLQWCEYEKQQLSHVLSQQYVELTQQLTNCQALLKQSLEELLSKDKQIEQLKQENKDIEYGRTLSLADDLHLNCF